MLFTPTETERINESIAEQSNVTTPKIIAELIQEHDTTAMKEGVAYYNNENDILKRKRYYYKDGVKVQDTAGLKPNNRIPHNWHRLLVDQKVSYIVGQPITFTAEDETFHDILNDMLCEEFHDTIMELAKGASNKGIEWLHPYIDEEGNFDYVVIPAEEFIPIHEGSKQKKLQYGLRYYEITVNGEPTIKAEWYDEREVTYYIKRDGQFILDDTEPVNPASHFYFGEEGYGWGRVPFIPFENNSERLSDLKFYKELIDEYDRTVSDNANDFEEMQEIIYILRGYEGQDLSEFMQNLLFYKAINVDGEGGVDTLDGEVPMDSAEKHLNRLEESIYTFGQGVNTKTDKFGNNPTGVALKFLYSLLDLKVDHVERKFKKGLQQLMWFITEYLRMSGQGDFDPRTVEFTFNRSMITNELEMATMAQQSKGIISDETIVAHHPWVTDVRKEMDRLEQQNTIDLESVPFNNEQVEGQDDE